MNVHVPWRLSRGVAMVAAMVAVAGGAASAEEPGDAPGGRGPAAGIVAWGHNECGQSVVPLVSRAAVSVAGGALHSLARMSDGTVMAWGHNQYGQIGVPQGLAGVVAVSAGSRHSLALRQDGTVVAWGSNDHGQGVVPARLRDVSAISAGGSHNLALTREGAVVAWGRNGQGQTSVPAGLGKTIAIAAGAGHSLAVRADGTVAGWGDNSQGQAQAPRGLSGVTTVAAGASHSLALRKDGTVVAWGGNDTGQSAVPSGLNDVTAIAAGASHSMALKRDGTVVVWGSNQHAQTAVPKGLRNVRAIAAGAWHSLVVTAPNYLLTKHPATDNQRANVGKPFGLPLAVKLSADGGPVPGVTVRFDIVDNALTGTRFTGGATSATTVTDQLGNAFAPVLMAGTRPGKLEVTAGIDGQAGAPTVRFTATVTNPVTLQLAQTTVHASPGSAVPAPDLTALDGHGAPLPNVPVTFTIMGGTAQGWFAGNRTTLTVRTDRNGKVPPASWTLTVGCIEGQFTIDGTIAEPDAAPVHLTVIVRIPFDKSPQHGHGPVSPVCALPT